LKRLKQWELVELGTLFINFIPEFVPKQERQVTGRQGRQARRTGRNAGKPNTSKKPDEQTATRSINATVQRTTQIERNSKPPAIVLVLPLQTVSLGVYTAMARI